MTPERRLRLGVEQRADLLLEHGCRVTLVRSPAFDDQGARVPKSRREAIGHLDRRAARMEVRPVHRFRLFEQSLGVLDDLRERLDEHDSIGDNVGLDVMWRGDRL